MPRGIYNRQSSRPRVTSTAKDTARHNAGTTSSAPTGATITSSDDGEPQKLTAKLTRSLESIRVEVVSFFESFRMLEQRRKDFAPKFMKVFEAWKLETSGTLAAFVRIYVPDLPMDVKGYKAHTAYGAADYLRRLVQNTARENVSPTEQAKRIAERPKSPRVAFIRLLASVMPLLDPVTLKTIKDAMHAQLNWSDAQVNGIMDEVATEPVLVRVRPPRGVVLDHQLKLAAAPMPVEPEEVRTGTEG